MRTFRQFLKESDIGQVEPGLERNDDEPYNTPLTESMDKKDQKYLLDREGKLYDELMKWKKEFEIFCRELYDEGNLEDEAEILFEKVDYTINNVRMDLTKIASKIKKS